MLCIVLVVVGLSLLSILCIVVGMWVVVVLLVLNM